MKKFLMILILVFIILFCFGISKPKKLKVEEPIKEEKKEVLEEPLPEEDPSSDIVGTIYVPNTDFKAVITQTSDNVYYLNHDVDGKSV